ncbi:MAG: hypothetical protein JWN11_1268, partial [Hyphomicrobiales bacterium]|nr:hypothetical protein [Hyphomicrobiales bacterium]
MNHFGARTKRYNYRFQSTQKTSAADPSHNATIT